MNTCSRTKNSVITLGLFLLAFLAGWLSVDVARFIFCDPPQTENIFHPINKPANLK